ncbi:MAG: protein kinase, partial [Chloroflexota bacterium]
MSDFGIAKDLGAEQQVTAAGVVIGSFDYISPEQIKDEPVSAQSDLYSLGAVLYETLAGEKPFPDSSVAKLLQSHLTEPFPSLAAARPDLPSRVDDVLRKATAKEPSERFATALEMSEAFRRALSDDELPLVESAPGALPSVIEVYNPYKGLRAFQEADADDFFGREILVHQLLARLQGDNVTHDGSVPAGRFLAVVGPSGSGKSSVVKAGLIPALRDGAIDGSAKWFVAEMVPGSHPFEELEMALWSVAVDPPPNLVDPMRRDKRGIMRTIQRILPDEQDAQLLLVIDQFEELFTLVTDDEQRELFIEGLLMALRAPRNLLRVVVTLRADFYDRPLAHQLFGKVLKENTEVVLPLALEELNWVVRE